MLQKIPFYNYIHANILRRNSKRFVQAVLTILLIIFSISFLLIRMKFTFSIECLAMAVITMYLVMIAMVDHKNKLIPNSMIYPGVVMLIFLAPFWPDLGSTRIFFGISNSTGSFLNSTISGISTYILLLCFYLAYPNRMGGGDVKYMGMLGLLTGFPNIVVVWCSSILIAGIYSITMIPFRKKNVLDKIPFGIFLSIGGILGLFLGEEMVLQYQNLVQNTGSN